MIAGLTNDFISYITTPEEYERQHYEGGSTLFGTYEQPFLTDRLVELGEAMASGEPAPEPDPYDPENGVAPDGPAYPEGAASGTLTAQPKASVPRFGHAEIAWSGGPMGHDRPVDKPFVIVERKSRGKWKRVDSDLGLAILWRVDEAGAYTAYWEVPRGAKLGTYRLRIAATRYELTSDEFRVVAERGPDRRARRIGTAPSASPTRRRSRTSTCSPARRRPRAARSPSTSAARRSR